METSPFSAFIISSTILVLRHLTRPFLQVSQSPRTRTFPFTTLPLHPLNFKFRIDAGDDVTIFYLCLCLQHEPPLTDHIVTFQIQFYQYDVIILHATCSQYVIVFSYFHTLRDLTSLHLIFWPLPPQA
jgi:hypothetical protein